LIDGLPAFGLSGVTKKLQENVRKSGRGKDRVAEETIFHQLSL
jgi:hypothetical protein